MVCDNDGDNFADGDDLLFSRNPEHAHSIFLALCLSRVPVHNIFWTWMSVLSIDKGTR